MKSIRLIIALWVGSLAMLNAQSFEEHRIDCDAGNAKACYDAGKIHSAQAYKEQDYDSGKAAREVALYYKRSCELGHAEGCTAYAMSYAADRKKDPSRDARYYFQKGCDGGDDRGCTMLKMMPSGQ